MSLRFGWPDVAALADFQITLVHVLCCAAIVPPAVLLIYIYRHDRVEREPLGLLLRLLLGGALSVIPAVVLEDVGFFAAGRLLPPESTAHAAVTCFLVIAPAEEWSKRLFLKWGSWKHRAFNYRFDAIVYAVFVSMGFAVVENLLYVLGSGALSTALLRAVTAVPAHAAFAVTMGYYYGAARLWARAAEKAGDEKRAAKCEKKSRRALRLALWAPALLHGFYDFCLLAELPWMGVVFVLFVVVMDFQAIRRIRRTTEQDAPV